MEEFKTRILNKVKSSLYNNYGLDNYDEERFGKIRFNDSLLENIVFHIKKLSGYKKNINIQHAMSKLKLMSEMNWLYSILDNDDKELLIEIIAYRLLGYKKVKLSINNSIYSLAIEKSKKLGDYSDTINPGFMHIELVKFDLNPIGKNVKFYFTHKGVATDFMIEQYAYKKKMQALVQADPGDVVLDIGGCWGDTALYFADKVGVKGRVYSFEFIPANISLFNKNVNLNPHLSTNIELIEFPVSDTSGKAIYFKDYGPGSKVEVNPFTDQTGSTTTISIDDYVKQKGITKIDFIKMDIEGAEPLALKGAIETIKKHRPKLAIAIYHSMSDFVNIPRWIYDLNLGYELYLGHYTIHSEETIIFAKVK